MMHHNATTSPIIDVALEDVRSAHNVGSIFRTADAAGVAHMHLIGAVATPIDRFGRPQSDIAKTALGAEHTVPWTHYESTDAFLHAMRTAGTQLIVVEQDARAVPLLQAAYPPRRVLIFGNEVSGVSAELRDAADQMVYIPMYGDKESLNVAVAAGIALYYHILATT